MRLIYVRCGICRAWHNRIHATTVYGRSVITLRCPICGTIDTVTRKRHHFWSYTSDHIVTVARGIPDTSRVRVVPCSR